MDGVAVQEPRPQLIKDFGVPVHSVVLCAGLRMGSEKQRGHPVGEPDGCQGPVRQLVVLDHCVTGREDLVHHHVPLRCHRRKGALVLLRVNPFHGHRHQSICVRHEHLLSGLDVAGENRRHPLLGLRGVVAGGEDEVRGGEVDFVARLCLDHVEDPVGGGVSVYEHDEVGVERVSVVICCQDPVAGLEVFNRLLCAILKGHRGGAWEAAA